MGMDFIDMQFRIERRFGLRLEQGWWEPIVAGRKPFDLTAGEVCAAVEARLDAVRRQEQSRAAPGSAATVLDYESRQRLSVHAAAPGAVPDTDAWQGVREAIAAALDARPGDVHKHSWLVKDLGMT